MKMATGKNGSKMYSSSEKKMALTKSIEQSLQEANSQ
jgi:hypothetical protein